MPKLLKSIGLILFILFSCSTFVLAEDITITTYYPSPYGSYKNLNIYNQDESITQTDFTQALTNGGIIITTDYTDTAFTPGIFWTMTNSTPTTPKAGIYLKETNVGTNMYFGTSNNYATGITNDALVIDPSGNVGIGTTGPTTKLDVRGGGINVETYGVEGRVGSAMQTGAASIAGQSWIDIPGATVTFTLPRTMTVGMIGHGSITPSGGVSTFTHCGFRFVVDGTGQGNASWGDQLLGCGKGVHPGWWCPWYIQRELSLDSGSHTIKLQMTGWASSDVACTCDSSTYSAARLWIEAR